VSLTTWITRRYLGSAHDVWWTQSWLGRFGSRVGRRLRELDDPTMYAESLRRDEEERRARQEQVGGVPKRAASAGRVDTMQWPWTVGYAVVALVGGDAVADAASIDKWTGQVIVAVLMGVPYALFLRRSKRRIG
jgi:hypothetical protein